MTEKIGMMDAAYFTSANECLDWANSLLGLNLTNVEQCATGAVHCQVIDAIYPGTVQMGKVTWGAKHEFEFVNNYKVLQAAFDKNGIQRHIDVQKLIKARRLDNLEFLQWIKKFFDMNYGGQEYDAIGRRKG